MHSICALPGRQSLCSRHETNGPRGESLPLFLAGEFADPPHFAYLRLSEAYRMGRMQTLGAVVLLTASCTAAPVPDIGVGEDGGCGRSEAAPCPDAGEDLFVDAGHTSIQCTDGGIPCSKEIPAGSFEGILDSSYGNSFRGPDVLPSQDQLIAFAWRGGLLDENSGTYMFKSPTGVEWSQGERVFDKRGTVMLNEFGFHMWYQISDYVTPGAPRPSIGYASSDDGSTWVDFGEILAPGTTPIGPEGFPLDEDGVFTSTAWFDGFEYHLLFHGASVWSTNPPGPEEDDFSGRSSIGHARGTSPHDLQFQSWILAADRCAGGEGTSFQEARIRQPILPLCPGGNSAHRAIVWMATCEDESSQARLLTFDGQSATFEATQEWPLSEGTVLFSPLGAWTYESVEPNYAVSLRSIDMPLPAVFCE